MATLEQTLRERFAKYADLPSIAPVQIAFDRTLNIHETFRSKAEEAAKDPHKTALGRQDGLRKYVREQAHEIIRARKTLEKVNQKAAERAAALHPKFDPATAEFRREARGMLRTMKAGERERYLLAENADPIFIHAALEVPNALTGLSDQIRGLVLEKAIESDHPGALARMEREKDAIEHLAIAVQVLEGTARALTEFPSPQLFEDFIADSVGDTSRLNADIESQLASAA